MLYRRHVHHGGVQQAEEHAAGHAAQDLHGRARKRHGPEEDPGAHNVQVYRQKPGRPSEQ